jgi:hypothetical protein
MDVLEHVAKQAEHAGLLPEGFWPDALRITQGRRELISSYYCEIRLGDARARADLLYAAKPSSFAAWLQASQAVGETGPTRRLLELIAAKGSRISGLWFEHDDIARTSLEPPQPSLCVCLVPYYHGERVLAADASSDISLICDLVESMTGALPASQAQRIRRVVGCLPVPGRFIHLSFMVGREPNVIKLYGVVPREQLVEYLREIGWAGPLHDIAALVERHCPHSRVAQDIYLDLTLDTLTVPGGNRLGFAFTPQHLEHSSERDPGRKPLLDQWVQAGLCSVWQRDALVRWPALLVDGDWGDAGWPMRLHRWLDLKCVWEPSAGLLGKAYLGFAARRMSPFESLM